MTFNSSNMFQALQTSRDYELQAMMTIINARSGASHSGGVNPADDAGSGKRPNSTTGTGSVPPLNPNGSSLDNTIQAYGLMAQIAMLCQEDPNATNSQVQAQIQADLAALSGILGGSGMPNIDPTCLRDLKLALSAFSQASTPADGETAFLAFWNNNPATPGNPSFNPLEDAFAYMASANPNLQSLSAADGFSVVMILLSVEGNKTADLGDGGMLDQYLSQPNISFALQNFIFTYGASIGLSPTQIADMLPPAISGDTVYTQFLAQLQAAAPTFAQNFLPNPSDPNYQEELAELISADWSNLSQFQI